MTTDFELLVKWRGGDQDAGDELLGRHFVSVYSFFRSKLPDQAEDLTQRTFLDCVAARERIDDRGSFKAYLFGIARGRLLDQLRRHYRKDAKIDLGVTSIHDLAVSPSRAADAIDERRLLLFALRRIPIDFQITIELFYWEGMTIAEIGAVLGVAEGTVKSRLSRAKEQLRVAMEQVEATPDLREGTLTNLDAWVSRLRNLLGDERGPGRK